MTAADDPRPPGEAPADALAEHLADVEVVGGPHEGEVWTYEADHGGYLPVDPQRRMAVKDPVSDVGGVIAYTGAITVRPVQNEEE